MIEQVRREKLEAAATDQLDLAFKTGSWFAVVLRVEDKTLHLQETTCDFPTGDFDKSLRLIKEAIQRKLGEIPDEPLPLAPHLMQSQEQPLSPCMTGEYTGPIE